jgi:hypothetical protein
MFSLGLQLFFLYFLITVHLGGLRQQRINGAKGVIDLGIVGFGFLFSPP